MIFYFVVLLAFYQSNIIIFAFSLAGKTQVLFLEK